jgi:hypothetical protein
MVGSAEYLRSVADSCRELARNSPQISRRVISLAERLEDLNKASSKELVDLKLKRASSGG